MIQRILLFGRSVPAPDELMICDEERARFHSLPQMGFACLICAVGLVLMLGKLDRPALGLAVSLNLLDAGFGYRLFQDFYTCGTPGFFGLGLVMARKYLFPALNLATLGYLLTGYRPAGLVSVMISLIFVVSLFGLGVVCTLFLKLYSYRLAEQARSFFVKYAGSLSPAAEEYAAGWQRSFCSRRKTSLEGRRPIEATPARFVVAKAIQGHYAAIKLEVVAALTDHPQLFQTNYGYSENSAGQWKSVPLWFSNVHAPSGERRRLYEAARQQLPKTMDLLTELDSNYEIAGEAMLSILVPGGWLRPHRDWPAGTQTTHLGLVIPPRCALQVGGQTYVWKEGESVVFDPSYLHEALNGSDQLRVVLLIDIWDPRFSRAERQAMIAYQNWKRALTTSDTLWLLVGSPKLSIASINS